jgi:hypothetical protein
MPEPRKAKAASRTKRAVGRKTDAPQRATRIRAKSTTRGKKAGKAAKRGTPQTMTVDTFIAGLPPLENAICTAVRRVIHAALPGVQESVKWRHPYYLCDGPVCIVVPVAGRVNLEFFHGVQLRDQQGRIEGTGKNLRHIKLRDLADVDERAISGWLQETVRLNRAVMGVSR